jgi:hypothetical protein
MNRPSLLVLVLVFAGTVSTVGQAPHRSVFTDAEAEAGRIEIQKNSFGDCSSCHTATLSGRTGEAGEVPALESLPQSYQQLVRGNGGRVPDLVGPGFRSRWASRTTRDLIKEFEVRFSPPSGQLTEQTRLNMIAYILQANGASPGSQPITMATETNIASLMPERDRP